MSRKNLIQQVIKMADGTTKTINHQKPGKGGDYKNFWQSLNTAPKPNSKRQKKLAAENKEETTEETSLKIGGEE